jgi:hypothetical protein
MKKLFAVYLGGKAKGATIEVHDVVFVVAATVKAAFPKLKKLWFGVKSSAHVDSWIELTEVDGHRLELIPQKTGTGGSDRRGPKLYLINVGFYEARVFSEQHAYHFLVCGSKDEAKARARKLYLKNTQLPHLDNVIEIDDLVELSEVDGFRLKLTKAKSDDAVSELEVVNVYWPLKVQ